MYVKDVLTGDYHTVSGSALTIAKGWSAGITGLQAASWSVGLRPVMTKPDGTVIKGSITWSDAVTVSVPGTERRTGVTAKQTDGTRDVTVSWSNPDDSADTLSIYVDGALLDQVSGTVNEYIINEMETGLHTVSITAASSNGTGLATPDVTVAVYDPEVMVKPTGLRYEMDEDSGDMVLSWETSGTVDTFRIYREEDGTGILVATVKKCTATLESIGLGDYTLYVVPVSVLDSTHFHEGEASDSLQVTMTVYTDAKGLRYETTDMKTATVTGYSGTATSVTIPSSVGCCKVTAIGASAFEGCKKLKSITIPTTVTSVGRRAFANCPALASMQ